MNEPNDVRGLRRRRRRIATSGVIAVVVVAAFASLSGDVGKVGRFDTPEQQRDPSRSGPAESPAGADLYRGVLDDSHIEATELRGLFDCADDADVELPESSDATAGVRVIESLRTAGLDGEAFVTGSSDGGDGDGVPSVALSRRYGPTLDFLAANGGEGALCVQLPRVGAYNEAPGLAAIEILVADERASDRSVVVEVGDGCRPNALWRATVVRDLEERIEIAHLLGASDGLTASTGCEPPETLVVRLPTPRRGRPVVAATVPATMEFTSIGRGRESLLAFDPSNVAGDGATMGDDLLAQKVDDPSIQFQVSDVFGEVQIASTPRPIFADQWPITGGGRMGVPADVPAGTYQVHFIHHPEINGVLTVS